MTIKLLLAPVGAGKTRHILDHLAQKLEGRLFAPVWTLLASKRQEEDFRQRLLEQTGQNIVFNVEFLNFYELYQRLLDMAQEPQRLINNMARYGLLRTILHDLRGELRVYHTIADRPGLAQIVADMIVEFKQNQIPPEALRDVAVTPRDHDLALIYNAYQETLRQHRLVDLEGQGWLAVEALQNDSELAGQLDLLLVDGFDQFTPVQADLLALLADRTQETLITLTTVPRLEATAGRRFQRARDQLEARLGPLGLITERLVADDQRHPDLKHLVQNIFVHRQQPVPSFGGINLIEAPDPASEVGAVLRRIKRLLLDGVAPDQILVALRDWERYRAHFTALGRKYGLPLALHYGEPLAENPAILALIGLLTLHEHDFPRRDLLDTLRSAYLDVPGLGDDAVNILERISEHTMVTGGRAAWLDAVSLTSVAILDEDTEREALLLDGTEAAELSMALARFFDAVTPPQEDTLAGYIQWLEARIGEDPRRDPDIDEAGLTPGGIFNVNMIVQVRAGSADDAVIARDVTAMQEFKRMLRGLLTGHILLETLGTTNYQSRLSWGDFMTDLLAAVGSTAINPRPNRSGRVLVTTATDARGLPHQHVFILGLSEGLFPARIPEDPIYLDSERRSLQERGLLVETSAERSADDGLFYELICLPRESLTCTRPALDNGQPWPASALWRASAAVFSDGESLIRDGRIAIGQIVPPGEAATRDEAALSITGASDGVAQESQHAVHAWLQAHEASYLAHIRAGHRIESDRLNGIYNHFHGRMRSTALRDEIIRWLGPSRKWSASQLNDYGACGFRFFAIQLLKLEALRTPEEGMDVRQRGSLLHAILEHTYRRIMDAGLTIIPENLEMALSYLQDVADDILNDAPRKFGFRAPPMWRQEQETIKRQLAAAVKADFEGEFVRGSFGDMARVPYLLEGRFGLDERPPLDVAFDAGADVGRIRLRGIIDRIDRQGDRLIVIDYKSGSTKISLDELESGRNFQMMVYLAAAEAIAARIDTGEPLEIAGGLFWHLSNRETSGALKPSETEGVETLKRASAHLARYIAAARQADFAIHLSRPDSKGCVRYCEFSRLCRYHDGTQLQS